MSRERAQWRIILLSYPCLTCGAKPGEDCRTTSGKRADMPHADRGRRGERCPNCGATISDGEPGQLCARCDLIRALEVERATTHKRRD